MKKRDNTKLNLISFTGNRNPNAKLDELTTKRAQEGWIWVKHGNTKKQIHPDKWEAHEQNGWQRITKTKS